MNKPHLLVKYCSSLNKLADLLKTINPDDIVSITEKVGFTVIYKSNSEYRHEYKKFID